MYYKKLLFVLVGLLFFSLAEAQVTIGSLAAPRAGAILDLKEDDSVGTNSTKGLLMPRVALEKRNELKPTYTGTLTESIKESHTGLILFNMSTILGEGLCPGLYVWNSEEWKRLYGRCGPDITPSVYDIYVDSDGFRRNNATEGVIKFTYAAANEVTVSSLDNWYFLSHDQATKTITIDVAPSIENIERRGTISLTDSEGSIVVNVIQESLGWEHIVSPDPISQEAGTVNVTIRHNSTRRKILETQLLPGSNWTTLSNSIGGDLTIAVNKNTSGISRFADYQTELNSLPYDFNSSKRNLGGPKIHDFQIRQMGTAPYLKVNTRVDNYPLNGWQGHYFEVESNVDWVLVNKVDGPLPTIDGDVDPTSGFMGTTKVFFKTHARTTGANGLTTINIQSLDGSITATADIIGRPTTSDIMPSRTSVNIDVDGFDETDETVGVIKVPYLAMKPVTSITQTPLTPEQNPTNGWYKVKHDASNNTILIDAAPNNSESTGRTGKITLSNGESTTVIELVQPKFETKDYPGRFDPVINIGRQGELFSEMIVTNSKRRIQTEANVSLPWARLLNNGIGAAVEIKVYPNPTVQNTRHAGFFINKIPLNTTNSAGKQYLGYKEKIGGGFTLYQTDGDSPIVIPPKGRWAYKDSSLSEVQYSEAGYAFKQPGSYAQVTIKLVGAPAEDYPIIYTGSAVQAGSYAPHRGVEIHDDNNGMGEYITVQLITLGSAEHYKKYPGAVTFFFTSINTGKRYSFTYRSVR